MLLILHHRALCVPHSQCACFHIHELTDTNKQLASVRLTGKMHSDITANFAPFSFRPDTAVGHHRDRMLTVSWWWRGRFTLAPIRSLFYWQFMHPKQPRAPILLSQVRTQRTLSEAVKIHESWSNVFVIVTNLKAFTWKFKTERNIRKKKHCCR